MKFVIIALALVAVASAAPPPASPGQVPQTLRSEFDQQPEGGYNFSFETDNGISRNENGETKTVNDEDNKPQIVIVVRGSYAYTDPEGHPVSVNYVADENGYHAEGDSIPKAARR